MGRLLQQTCLLLLVVACLVTPSLANAPLTYETEEMIEARVESVPTQCGKIVADWTVAEARNYVYNTVDDSIDDWFARFTLKLTIGSYFTYGVRVMKICSSCGAHASSTSNPTAYAEFCSSDDYGYSATNSGLLLIPTTSTQDIVPGTHAATLYMHGTSTARVPTTVFTAAQEFDIEMALNIVVASTGKFAINPDYLGYGESSGLYHKGYLIAKQYSTSCVPLFYEAQDVVAQQSNCAAAVADAAALTGFSEGGYAAVTLSDTLQKMGLTLFE